jgi:hypothetical protein
MNGLSATLQRPPLHEPAGGSSKSQTANPKKAPITKFQMPFVSPTLSSGGGEGEVPIGSGLQCAFFER